MLDTVVMPPAAAAIVPVVKSSRSVWPGSSKCACMSIAPGITTSPDASISSSDGPPSPRLGERRDAPARDHDVGREDGRVGRDRAARDHRPLRAHRATLANRAVTMPA